MTQIVSSQALVIVFFSLKLSQSISQHCLAPKLGPFVYGLGASAHVGICAQFLKGMQFSRIQKTWTVCEDLQGFLNNEDD